MSVLDEILEKLVSIENRLSSLEKQACDINVSCKGMDRHISFVDSIYEKLKKPILWITNRFSGKTLESLPMAPTKLQSPPHNSLCDAVVESECIDTESSSGDDSDSDSDSVFVL